MGLFGSGDDADSQDKEPKVTAAVPEEKEYTEHTAVAVFSDGSEMEFTFDKMQCDGGVITLANYTGIRERDDFIFTAYQLTSQKFAVIPLQSLRVFETVERETKVLEDEVEKTVSRSEAIENGWEWSDQ